MRTSHALQHPIGTGRRRPARPAAAYPDWFGEVKRSGVLAVGAALNGPRPVREDRPRDGMGPCPACAAPRRHPKRKDKRGAIGLTNDGSGWRCHECDASGDAVTLAALLVLGRRPPKGDPAWRDVWRACAAAGLCDPNPWDREAAPVLRASRPTPLPAPAPLERPAGAAAIWAELEPVTSDPEAIAYLEKRQIDPALVEDRNLARVLPADYLAPEWMTYRGKRWNNSPHGFRLIVPRYNAAGVLEALFARALTPRSAQDKAAWPKGCACGHLVMADALARLMLAGGALGDGSPAADLVRQNGLWILEGEPDFLSAATEWADEGAPAVIGVASGSWPADAAELAARVPDGCTVIIATDPDTGGEKYASAIKASLAERMRRGLVRVKRWKAPGAPGEASHG